MKQWKTPTIAEISFSATEFGGGGGPWNHGGYGDRGGDCHGDGRAYGGGQCGGPGAPGWVGGDDQMPKHKCS